MGSVGNYNKISDERVEMRTKVEPVPVVKPKYTLILYYGINDMGDGSASVEWYESAELAEFCQEPENRASWNYGWAESCTGEVKLESDSPITVKGLAFTSKESYVKELEGTAEYSNEEEKKNIAEIITRVKELK